MKKYDEDGMGCESCMGAGEANCIRWMQEIGESCGRNPTESRAYANKEQCEALLKYWDNKNGSIANRLKDESVENKDFRVDDKVTLVGLGDRIIETRVTKVGPVKPGLYPVRIHLMGEGGFGFKIDGEGGRGLKIYHGHNLEITVKEKLPVRPVVKWVYLFVSNFGVESSQLFNSKEQCKNMIKATSRLKIVSGPIEIKLPEDNK